MSYSTARFPVGISQHATGGPQFQVSVGRVDGGAEYRNTAWSQRLARYEVAHSVRTQADFDTLLTFYMSVGGRLHTFPFKDWADYAATASQGVFVMLTSTTFQAYKSYAQGGLTHLRKIIKPRATMTVTGGSSPVVDYTTGIVTVASGTPTAWAGEFDVPCRFDTDVMQAEIIDGTPTNRIMGWNSIPIVEVRSP